MKVTFLPVPSIVLNFVEFIVKMSGLKIINRNQMAPVVETHYLLTVYIL